MVRGRYSSGQVAPSKAQQGLGIGPGGLNRAPGGPGAGHQDPEGGLLGDSCATRRPLLRDPQHRFPRRRRRRWGQFCIGGALFGPSLGTTLVADFGSRIGRLRARRLETPGRRPAERPSTLNVAHPGPEFSKDSGRPRRRAPDESHGPRMPKGRMGPSCGAQNSSSNVGRRSWARWLGYIWWPALGKF